MLRQIEGRRRRGWPRMRELDGITDSMEWAWASSRSRGWTGKPGMLQSLGSQRVGHWTARFIMQIHSAQRGHGRPKNRREFLSFKFSCHKIWILFHRMNLLPSSSRLLAAQLLAAVGLRHPFPVGSLTLLPEPARFPFQDFLMLPCMLWVFPSITSFSLQPEKVICSCDRLGVCFLWLPW